MVGNKLRCLKCPLKSVKSLSHAGNNIEIRLFGIWKLSSYISDLRVLGREASECLFRPPASAQPLWRWKLTSCSFPQHPLSSSHVQALLKGLDFFSLSIFKPLSAPFLARKCWCSALHFTTHIKPWRPRRRGLIIALTMDSSMLIKGSQRPRC